MFAIVRSAKFKKDAKKYQNDQKAQSIILDVISLLAIGAPLPAKYKEHSLIGNYVGYLECHGRPDLLLIYQRDFENKQIKLYRVGSHADLFK
ncbi:type II toxin-antitoxin system YafQ family toxin [Testudinibacter aquarius]|uniref:Type II toxin-antitoxin system YafQ family toxin n=1 Tax=Testudinibacter aquarius TaxID=1524974 RepID=A0A4R3Y9K6_9PAST|nr:type II toxin-antitoxin system YafQ family toxin [Testudinibacter aquarius]KAE9529205.1 addiction module toxin RelE [Testudinibacter aquarius]TCV87324.1 mRNA interferase YafQ [Testudinibacter aquarius]TNG92865.1 type II toxin-antitoxin system YafQ family toxin [Testudinibacter aquarius]